MKSLHSWKALAWEAGRLLTMALNRDKVLRIMGDQWMVAAGKVTDDIFQKQAEEK